MSICSERQRTFTARQSTSSTRAAVVQQLREDLKRAHRRTTGSKEAHRSHSRRQSARAFSQAPPVITMCTVVWHYRSRGTHADPSRGKLEAPEAPQRHRTGRCVRCVPVEVP